MKRQYYNTVAPLQRDRAIAQLRRLEARLFSPQARFAIPFVYRGPHGWFKSINPRQNNDEIERLYQRVCRLRPRRVLEIGTARGGTLYLWTQAAADDATLVSVDLPGGDYGGGYPQAKVPFYQSFARAGQSLHLLRADSHQDQTRHQVRDLFDNQPIDFAFIDGDHTYEGVKADFEQYGPMVRPGGLIAFHDTLPRDPKAGIEVSRFWQELQSQYPDAEQFIGHEDSGRQVGIGVLTVPDAGLQV